MQRELGIEREEQDHRQQRHEDGRVAQPHLARCHAVADAVVHRADEQPQRVHARHHHPAEGDRGYRELGFKDAEQDQELTDEVARAGHRQRGERDDQEQRSQHGRAERDAAHAPQVLGASRALRKQGDDEQERRHDEAVVDHLQQRALGPLGVEREDAQRDEAELRHGGVADDQARVGLREGDERPVHDGGQRDQQHQRLEVGGGVRVQRQHDREKAVGADLGEHAGEDHQHLDGHRAVGIGHPAVQREGGHLDQKGGGEGQEDPLLRAGGER